MKTNLHKRIVRKRITDSPAYRRAFLRNVKQINLAMLIREMREAAGLSQKELAARAGTTQSAIARLEDAEYAGHSLKMLEKLAAACEVSLKIRAQRKPALDRELILVAERNMPRLQPGRKGKLETSPPE